MNSVIGGAIFICSFYCSIDDYVKYLEDTYEELAIMMQDTTKDVIICGRIFSEMHMMNNMIKKYAWVEIYKIYYYEIALVVCERISLYRPVYDIASYLYEKSFLTLGQYKHYKTLYKNHVSYLTKLIQTKIDNIDGKAFKEAFRLAKNFSHYGEYYFTYNFPIGFPKERRRDNVYVNVDITNTNTTVTLWNKKPCSKGKILLIESPVSVISQIKCFECSNHIGSVCRICHVSVCMRCKGKHLANCNGTFRDVLYLSQRSCSGDIIAAVFFTMYKLIVYALRRMKKSDKLLDNDLFLGIVVNKRPCIYDRITMESYYLIMVYVICGQYKYKLQYEEYLDLFHRVSNGMMTCKNAYYFGRFTRLLRRSERPNVKLVFEKNEIRVLALKDLPANTPLYLSI